MIHPFHSRSFRLVFTVFLILVVGIVLRVAFEDTVTPVLASGPGPMGIHSISGAVTYGGSQSGNVHVAAFTCDDPPSCFPPEADTTLTSPVSFPVTYTIGGLSNGSYWVFANMDANGNDQADPEEPGGEYGSNPVVISGADQTSIDIALQDPPPPLIFGWVSLPDNSTPVPHAWVGVETLDYTFSRESNADSQGDFGLGDLLTDTTYLLWAKPPYGEPAYADYGQSRKVQVILGSQSITIGFPISLTQANVKGRVLDPGGNPACCAGVDVFNDDFSVHQSTGSDTDGAFRLGGLSPATYTLELHTPWGKSWLSPVPTMFVVTGTDALVDVGDVQFITPTKLVKGAVIRSNPGAGVADVEVYALKRGTRQGVNTSTDSSGDYSLGVSGGAWEVMIGPKPGPPVDWMYDGHPELVQFAYDASPETKFVTFTVVTADANVIGSVKGPNGETLNPWAVWVEVRDATGRGNGGPLQGDGSFDVPVVAGGYNLWVHVDELQYPNWGSPTLPPFAVASGGIYDAGEIRLVAKTSRIEGRVVRATMAQAGEGIAGAEIHAWKPEEGGWAHTFSAADGSFSLSVVSGTWEVAAQPPPGSSYVSGGPPQRHTIGDSEVISDVTFSLVEAAGTIEGTVRDVDGNVLTSVDGWAYARRGNSPEPTAGGELHNGTFSIQVPSGSYNVGVWLPPDSGYTPAGEEPVGPLSVAGMGTSSEVAMAAMVVTEHQVTVATGSSVPVTITLLSQNAWIVGGFFTDNAKTNPATGVQGEVFAMSGLGGTWQGSVIDPTTGQYQLHVAAQANGTAWNLGYWLKSGDYVNSPPPDSRVTIRPGETFTMNFTVVAADASITGTIQKPDGNPLPHAWAWAHRPRTVASASIDTGDDSDAAGSFDIRVPAGTYDVGAHAPEDWGYIQPEVITDVVAPAGGLVLRFKESDATITGTVYYHQQAGPPVYGPWAWVWAWSESGGHTGALTDEDGVYRLNVVTGTTWHVGANYQYDASLFYDTITETVLAVTGSVGGVDLDIYPNEKRMPPAVSRTFSATVGATVVLSDGTKIEIPAGAMPVTGTVRLVVVPLVEELPNTLTARPFGFGYGIYAYDSSGKQIVSKFNKNVYLTFSYTDAELAKRGVSEDDLSPAYLSTTTNSWTKAAIAAQDKTLNQVKVQIDHFSSWSMLIPQPGGDSYAVYLPVILKAFAP